MTTKTAQLDLFAPKPRSFDEAALIARLREAIVHVPRGYGMTRTQIKRLMTPLPSITVPR